LIKYSRYLLFLVCLSGLYQGLWAEQKQVKNNNIVNNVANNAAKIEIPSIKGKDGEFTLFSDKGAVSLSDFQGKVVAFYFGYSQCPDICPTNLNILGQALRKLSQQETQDVQPLFISMAPGRDSPLL